MKEIHLFIPSSGFRLPKRQGKNQIKPCYLDIKSGFINFMNDSQDGRQGIRKLYYCGYSVKGKPDIITFPKCPHCRHQLSSQTQLQSPVPGRTGDPAHFPNEGRKVLLFSDSRQRAAKLTRDMSETSDIAAVRQLFMIAVNLMETLKSSKEVSRNHIYDYFCLAAAMKHVQILHDDDREIFSENCTKALHRYERFAARRPGEYSPDSDMTSAPPAVQGHLMRLFCGGYKTLYDSALCWIEPAREKLFEALDSLEDEYGITVTEDEFLELFNAWGMYICDINMALGNTIPDTIRLEVRKCYEDYGLARGCSFSGTIKKYYGLAEIFL